MFKVLNCGEIERVFASPLSYDIDTGQTPLRSPSTDGNCHYSV